MCKRKLNDGQKPRRQRRKKIVNGKWYLTNSITFPLASVPPRLLVSFLSFAFLSALVNVGQTELFLLFSPFIIIIDKIKPATEPYAKLISCAHFWVGTPFLCAYILIFFSVRRKINDVLCLCDTEHSQRWNWIECTISVYPDAKIK